MDQKLGNLQAKTSATEERNARLENVEFVGKKRHIN
jgi:hypothetical protein